MVGSIEDCVSFLIGKAAQQITRRCREVLAEYGITPVQYAVLNVLGEKDGQSLAEIGARIVLDSATMTGVADRLEASGFVARRQAPNGDRRVTCLFLTKAARAIAAAAEQTMQTLNDEVAEELGSEAGSFWQSLRVIGNVVVPVNSCAPLPSKARKSSASVARPRPNSASPRATLSRLGRR